MATDTGMVSALKPAVPVIVISPDGQVRPFPREPPKWAHVVNPGWDDDERDDGALQRYARCREALVDGDLSAIPSGMSLEEWFETIEKTMALLQNDANARPTPPAGEPRRRPRQGSLRR